MLDLTTKLTTRGNKCSRSLKKTSKKERSSKSSWVTWASQADKPESNSLSNWTCSLSNSSRRVCIHFMWLKSKSHTIELLTHSKEHAENFRHSVGLYETAMLANDNLANVYILHYLSMQTIFGLGISISAKIKLVLRVVAYLYLGICKRRYPWSEWFPSADSQSLQNLFTGYIITIYGRGVVIQRSGEV